VRSLEGRKDGKEGRRTMIATTPVTTTMAMAMMTSTAITTTR
jgi:hypothetical protein